MEAFDQTPRPLHFGDAGEFVFDSCIETMDGDGVVIEEVTLFFHHGDKHRSLTIKSGDINAIVEGEPDGEVEPAIQTTLVDPHIVIKTLRMPSEALLALSQEVTSNT